MTLTVADAEIREWYKGKSVDWLRQQIADLRAEPVKAAGGR